LAVMIDQIFNLPGLMWKCYNNIKAFNTQIRKLLNVF
jgi:hypothetical protein